MRAKIRAIFSRHVKKEALDFMMFPLGGMYKSDVKEIARNIEVLKSFAEQKESSEICFVQNSYLEVLANHIDIDRPGDVVDESGKVIGAHRGYMHYTIGKRKGFTVNGAHDPHYVITIDEGKNQITVGTKEQLDCWRFEVEALVLYIPQNECECSVKIRYRSPKTPCHVSIHDGIADVVLHQSVQGVAPGQVAVFYEGDKIIASGWIKGATKTSIGENKDESQ